MRICSFDLGKREVVYACIAWVFWLSWEIDFRLSFGLEVVIGVDEVF
jgi:hypothetical protein